MEKSIEELATDILKEIEKEDFFHALRHYGKFRVEMKAKDIKKWWDDMDGDIL